MLLSIQELLEKKILKTGPYRPNSGKEVELPAPEEKEIKGDWHDTQVYKAPPYILGYTGNILYLPVHYPQSLPQNTRIQLN